MTYQDLKNRLEKCEYALKAIKDGTHKDINTFDINKTTQKLTVLKESLIKQLKTLEEANSKTYLVTPKSGQTTAVSMSDDETDALKDADDVKAIKGIDGEEIKEEIEFSIDETKAIAKKVGQAVAKSLKTGGDDLQSMKARDIEPKSFDIFVIYKDGKDDNFSFLISNDKLILQDFTVNKELVDIGVKPSGEPIINVDVLANELNKHFKSLNEGEGDDHHYIKVPRMEFKSAERLLAKNIDGNHVKMDYTDDDGMGNVIIYFMFKDDAIASGEADSFMYDAVMDLQSHGVDIQDHSAELDEALDHNDPTLMKLRADKMKRDKFAGQDPKAGSMIKGRGFDPIILKLKAKRAQVMRDMEQEAEPEGGPIADKYGDMLNKIDAAIAKARGLKEGDETDDYGRPYVDKKGSRTYIDDPMTDYMKRRRKENDYYQDPDYYKENKSEDEGGDLDIGHQDDEPDMLKQHAYDIAQYASKLYKALDKYDKYDGEVDFPNWWQSKLILARDYISKAQHYLEFEEKQPAIDQLALENVDKVAGGIPYKREGNKFIITEPLDDATKERIIGKAKEHGHNAAPNQAGGVTIMAKEGDGMTTKIKPSEGDPTNMAYTDKVNEDLSDDQREAYYELQNILDQAADLGNQARDIISKDFPNHLAQGDAYGVFNFGSSSNSYDTTLDSILSNIEHDSHEEIDENTEYSKYSKKDVDDLYDITVHTMKRLAKQYKAGDKSVVQHLKKLSAQKKQLEQEKINKVSDIGRDQELAESTDLYNRNGIQITRFAGGKDRGLMVQINYGGKYIHVPADEFAILARAMQSVIGDIKDMTLQMPRKDYPKNEAELDKKEKSQVKKIVKQLKKSVKGHGDQAKYLDKLSKESAPGYKHDCASKVVHEKYGKGTCIPEKHTLVKEGSKYVVTHYDVLFENGNTILDIPVNELEIKTQTEHWHKGYKKKKK